MSNPKSVKYCITSNLPHMLDPKKRAAEAPLNGPGCKSFGKRAALAKLYNVQAHHLVLLQKEHANLGPVKKVLTYSNVPQKDANSRYSIKASSGMSGKEARPYWLM